MSKCITKRQKRVLEFLEDYMDRHEKAPSFEEIRQHFGWSSKSVVAKHLAALEKKKKIQVTPRLSRSIKLVA